MAGQGSLGSISIDVLANIAGMVSDLGKAQAETNKFAHEMKETISGIGESFLKVAEIFGVGLSVEALKEVAARAFETAEQLDHLSQATGITVSTLQQMQSTATLTGTSLEVASGAIEKLERSAVQATTGNAKLASTFASIGIDAKQLGELLKDPDALIQEVTKHIAEFSNGAGKTAAVMQLMGRGAAQNIPLINELGEKFVELTLKAQQFGIQLSELDQAQLKGAAESLNEVKNAGAGLANQFAVAIAPAVMSVSHALVELATSGAVQQFFINLRDDIAEFVIVAGHVKDVIAEWVGESGAGTAHMRQDFAQFVADSKTEWDTLVAAGKIAALNIEDAFSILWAALKNGFSIAIASIQSAVSTLAFGLSQVLKAAGDQVGAIELSGISDGLKKLSQSYTLVSGGAEEYELRLQRINLDLAVNKKQNNDAAQAIRDEAIAMLAANKALDDHHKKQLQLGEDADKAAKRAQKLAEDMLSASKFLDSLAGKLDGDYSKAWTGYEGAIDQADKMAIKFTADGMSLAKVQQFIAEATELAREKLFEQTDATYNLDKALNAANETLAKHQALVGLTGTALAVEVEYEKLLEAAMKDLKGVMGPLNEADQRRIESLHGIAEATVAAEEATKAYEAAVKEWEGIAKNGLDSVGKSVADFATGGIKNWHDFGQSLIGDTKQFIAAIIEEFLKLELFNGIINQLFHTNLPEGLGSLAGIGGGGGSGVAGLAGNGGSLLSGGSSLLSSLGSLWGGSATGGSSLLGSGIGENFVGPLNVGQAYGYTPSLLGNAIGIGGGILAAYNEFKAAGGGVGGVVGGAAYGLGTLTAVGAVGGVLSGAGAAAGAAGALGSVGLGAIPVVGWVALAAMLIDKFSGGKLFGTSYKPTGNTAQNVSVGPDGATLGNSAEEIKNGALFSGHSWKWKEFAATADQTAAVTQMFTAIHDSVQQAATALGVQMPDIIGGAFKETFDKSGKMTSELSTVLGQTYSETIQQFAERVTADNLLALLPAASNATAIAAQWQKSADDLLAGTQFLLQAQSDITQGHALVQGDTLAQLTTFVQGMEQQGESLIQTYGRLSSETSTVESIFANLGLSTGKAGEALVTFDDTLTQMAGGLSNLTSAFNTYYSEYYSAAEQQANTLKQLQAQVTGLFASIGEDPKESMAKFRQDFEAAMPTLTPQQVLTWLAAGDALFQLNKALGTTTVAATQAATNQYTDFIGTFTAALNPMDAFQKSIFDLGTTLQANIDKANQLAQAAGMSGASIDDLTTILQASATAGAQALAQEEDAAQQLVSKLFGTSVQQLTTQLNAAQAKYATDHANSTLDYMFGAQDQQNIDAIQKQIDAANAQAQAAQNFSDSTGLLKNLGDIGAVTGDSLQSFATSMGIPLDKLAAYLNTDQAGLEKLYTQYESAALSQMEIAGNTKYTNELLADILAESQGKPLPFTGNEPSLQTITPKRGTPGQVNTLASDQPLTKAQGDQIIAHLGTIGLHVRDTSGNTAGILRKSNDVLPFNRNGRGVMA